MVYETRSINSTFAELTRTGIARIRSEKSRVENRDSLPRGTFGGQMTITISFFFVGMITGIFSTYLLDKTSDYGKYRVYNWKDFLLFISVASVFNVVCVAIFYALQLYVITR